MRKLRHFPHLSAVFWPENVFQQLMSHANKSRKLNKIWHQALRYRSSSRGGGESRAVRKHTLCQPQCTLFVTSATQGFLTQSMEVWENSPWDISAVHWYFGRESHWLLAHLQAVAEQVSALAWSYKAAAAPALTGAGSQQSPAVDKPHGPGNFFNGLTKICC